MRPQERLKHLVVLSVGLRGKPALLEPGAEYQGPIGPKTVGVERVATLHGSSYLGAILVVRQYRENEVRFEATYKSLAGG